MLGYTKLLRILVFDNYLTCPVPLRTMHILICPFSYSAFVLLLFRLCVLKTVCAVTDREKKSGEIASRCYGNANVIALYFLDGFTKVENLALAIGGYS